ncbi:(+)-neomenthol dehydrogenase-like isoform X2 [Malus sylvestris]|uniref:(+)-neomenthol dehydrogenase-like isoform X2 n=1 Tax=Malus domestica TaxID=3750 RepID=UPI0004986F22|nr:(+)-neomenthol dehydrogenase-like isoform X2 [Malus domestica]XP_028954249.1 (+)-neomenthol dehydrogenase-like isoform X2 [Malus domestica]XP_050138956.1 (+)-neomenthol dehydrogenase-like isoform X2 [Malus sylvestris]XP_050138957.1 (+)-neomenthol dehydrogenase-like isoform X2 [Malus sylvestris]
MGSNQGDGAETERCAVVSGANKGIGLEVVRQLASQGVLVVLTARDEKRGREATSKLHKLGLSNVVFHQLDVLNPVSIHSLAKFIHARFGRLDILVNNAGATGALLDEKVLKSLNIDSKTWVSYGFLLSHEKHLRKTRTPKRSLKPITQHHMLSEKAVNQIQGAIKYTYEKAEECLNTNYYGVKRLTEALLPLLQLSTLGARIVNVSSLRSELKRIPSEEIRNELGDVEALTEEKVDAVLTRFLHDFKQNELEVNGWTMMLPAYSISKATLNAYTRILANKYPNMCINCVHPGFVNTDLNCHTGTMTVEEGAAGPVKLALLPHGGPSGCYFDQTEVADF